MTAEQGIAASAALICGCVDARTGFIPNRATYPALSAILLAATWSHHFAHAASGALLIGGLLAFAHAATRGRGMGLGDAKLAACIGAGCGPFYGLIALASSFILGGCYGSYLLAMKKAGRKTRIRFGPFLAAGTLFALAAQTRITSWF
jgi:leader peptidase (prepilin peptidase)/N-methyltransferase